MGDCVSSIGLVFDIIGAVLIFLYGIPTDLLALMKTGTFEVINEDDPRVMSELKKHRRLSRTGLGFLIAGFSLQLAGNLI